MRNLVSISDLVGVNTKNSFVAKSVRAITPAYSKATVSDLRLRIVDIIPLSRFAVQDRLNRAQSFLKEALKSGLRIFELMAITEEGKARIVFPPVVEAWQSGFYLVDGVHRVLAAREMGYDSDLDVLGIDSKTLPPLPCEACSWDTIRTLRNQQKLEDILGSLDRSLFRPVSKHFNSKGFVFNSLQELIGAVRRAATEMPCQPNMSGR
jgi:hypothetical protein